jgi:hypothetical protein
MPAGSERASRVFWIPRSSRRMTAEKINIVVIIMRTLVSRSFLLFISLLLILSNSLFAENKVLQTEEVVVIFEEHQAGAAEEVAKIYPSVKSELAENLGWKIDFRPAVLLDRGGKTIRKNTGSEIFAAYAVPEKNLTVLDTSRVYAKPFSLESTLKHELCHLLIHHNIKNPPRWIDEGVCQWASGGIAEFITEDGKEALRKAAVSGRLIAIKKLVEFPREDIILAYEESKSIIEYIESEFGKQDILQILELMKEGHSIDDSVQKGLSVSISELDEKWQAYLKTRHGWFSYLNRNLYEILFFIAALATVYGFIRMLKKKKEYRDDPDDEDIESS